MITATIVSKASHRQQQILKQYIAALDKHVLELKEGEATESLEIKDFANMLHIHPVHLSNTVKEVTGQSTCSLYEARLLAAAKELLLNRDFSIKQVAQQLTYDPSNFTKFFKHFTGITPKQFRNQQP